MLIGVGLAEWWRSSGPQPRMPAPKKGSLPVVASILFPGLAGWPVANIEQARNVLVEELMVQTGTAIG